MCELGTLDSPGVVAEMADFFPKLSEVIWSAAMGFHKKVRYVSIRSVADSCDELIRTLEDRRNRIFAGENRKTK